MQEKKEDEQHFLSKSYTCLLGTHDPNSHSFGWNLSRDVILKGTGYS